MKKLALAVLTLIMCAAITGCGIKNTDAKALASSLASEGSFAEELTEAPEEFAVKQLFLGADEFSECSAYVSTAAVADVVIVVKTDDTENVTQRVMEYIDNLKDSYADYRPDEVPKLRDAVVQTVGDCVAVCVSKEPPLAQKIINEYK